MIFPTLAVVIGTLLALGDAAESLAKMHAARSKFMKGKDLPAVLTHKADGKLRKAAISPDTEYATSGWIMNNFFQDETCGSAIYTDGFAVNTCFGENGASYKYQLTGDSCTGAVRQDFTDDACATLDTTTELTGLTCVGGTGFSGIMTCTTASSPSLPYSNVMTSYYRATGCGTASSFSAFATDTCLGGFKVECSGNSGTGYSYENEDCTGTSEADSASDLGSCSTEFDDDNTVDDTYYAGDAAESYKTSCSNDAASLVNSLGAKTVLAIVVGAVAYMAF